MELINAYGFGIAIATKSDLITRDIDILKDVKKVSPVLAKITVTTSDDEIASKVEPNAPRPSKRFSAIEKLSSSGIYTGILMMPVLPFIEDNPDNITEIIHMAKESGAKFIYPAFGVTLRTNQRDWYYEKLSESFPGLSQKYKSKYGNAYECRSPKAKELWEMFSQLCRENRILFGMSEIIRAYKADYTDLQLKLF